VARAVIPGGRVNNEDTGSRAVDGVK